VSNAINVLGPSLVLFGGFLATVRASDPEDLDRLVEAHTVRAAWEDVRLESAGLGDDLLMIGAAELAFAALLADPAAAIG
jgi:predicted NBD/HSP70 family sugar kinase